MKIKQEQLKKQCEHEPCNTGFTVAGGVYGGRNRKFCSKKCRDIAYKATKIADGRIYAPSWSDVIEPPELNGLIDEEYKEMPQPDKRKVHKAVLELSTHIPSLGEMGAKELLYRIGQTLN